MTLVIFSDEQKTHSELIEEATFMLTRTLKNTTLRNPHDYDTILDAVVDMYEVEVGSSAKGMSGTSKHTEEEGDTGGSGQSLIMLQSEAIFHAVTAIGSFFPPPDSGCYNFIRQLQLPTLFPPYSNRLSSNSAKPFFS